MGFSLKDILKATNGKVLRGSCVEDIKGVSIDTRTIRPGDIYIALKGLRFDGHTFIGEAFAKGASLVVVECADVDVRSGTARGSGAVVLVDDTLRALGDIARFNRERYPLPLLAVSGSTGKTTTKDMASLILGADGREVIKTEGNKNNLVGLPMTLLNLEDAFDVAVVELGISLPGEMGRLAEICKPDVAVLTNIGCGHSETLGDIEGVANEKGELFSGLEEDGIKVVNIDDPWAKQLADMDDDRRGKRGDRVTFSSQGVADVCVSEVTDFALDGTKVVYDVLGEDIEVRFNSPSMVNVINGAAAIAATIPLAAKPESMRLGLNAFMPESHRMVVLQTRGFTILDDTYNANPESVLAAINTLGRCAGRKVAVLGDMLELGDMSAEAHFNAGFTMAQNNIYIVVGVGVFAGDLKMGAISGGMEPDRVFVLTDNQEAVELLMNILELEDTVLVKGSRGATMEEVVFALSEVHGQS